MFAGKFGQSNDSGQKLTLDDMHREFSIKYGSQNHGLKPIPIVRRVPKPTSDSQTIFQEIKAKLQEKYAKK